MCCPQRVRNQWCQPGDVTATKCTCSPHHAEAATAAAEAPAGDVEAGRAGMGPTSHLSMGIPGVGGSGGGVLALAAKPAAKPGMWYQVRRGAA